MTWTYDAANIQTTPLYQVRMIIGDTLSTEPLLQDEEISFTLIRRNSVNGAAAMCSRSIAAKFSRLSDTTVGPQKFDLSQKAANYTKLADDLEQLDDATGGAFCFSGGISIANKQTYEADPDRVDPSFVKNGTDFPVAGGQTLQNTEDIPYWGGWP